MSGCIHVGVKVSYPMAAMAHGYKVPKSTAGPLRTLTQLKVDPARSLALDAFANGTARPLRDHMRSSSASRGSPTGARAGAGAGAGASAGAGAAVDVGASAGAGAAGGGCQSSASGTASSSATLMLTLPFMLRNR